MICAASVKFFASTKNPLHLSEFAFFEREIMTIVDQAQLWYLKPGIYGGGDRSFRNLDFTVLGFSDKAGSITYNGDHGSYMLTSIRNSSFDIVGTTPSGERFEAILIGYDTMPVIRPLD